MSMVISCISISLTQTELLENISSFYHILTSFWQFFKQKKLTFRINRLFFLISLQDIIVCGMQVRSRSFLTFLCWRLWSLSGHCPSAAAAARSERTEKKTEHQHFHKNGRRKISLLYSNVMKFLQTGTCSTYTMNSLFISTPFCSDICKMQK